MYGVDEDGNIINIIQKSTNKGNQTCYWIYDKKLCDVRKYGQKGRKKYQVHRFVWECYNGIISEGKVIDHINNIKDDNRLCNLRLMTQQENCKKSAKGRDYSFLTKVMKIESM